MTASKPEFQQFTNLTLIQEKIIDYRRDATNEWLLFFIAFLCFVEKAAMKLSQVGVYETMIGFFLLLSNELCLIVKLCRISLLQNTIIFG